VYQARGNPSILLGVTQIPAKLLPLVLAIDADREKARGCCDSRLRAGSAITTNNNNGIFPARHEGRQAD
jgi:hypothetical protein